MKKGIYPDDVVSAFKSFDTDGNGLIDGNEFKTFVTNKLKLELDKVELHHLWRSLDVDGLGSIDFAEFTATCYPSARAHTPEPTHTHTAPHRASSATLTSSAALASSTTLGSSLTLASSATLGSSATLASSAALAPLAHRESRSALNPPPPPPSLPLADLAHKIMDGSLLVGKTGVAALHIDGGDNDGDGVADVSPYQIRAANSAAAPFAGAPACTASSSSVKEAAALTAGESFMKEKGESLGIKAELAYLRGAVAGIDERLQRFETTCNGLNETALALQEAMRAMQGGLQRAQTRQRLVAKSRVNSRAAGLASEGEAADGKHGANGTNGANGGGGGGPPPLPGAATGAEGAAAGPSPGAALARSRADADFVADAKASAQDACSPTKDGPGRATGGEPSGALKA